jgi:hypothetical protein
MKTHLTGKWTNKLVSLVEVRDTLSSMHDIHHFISSSDLSEDEKKGFLRENGKKLVDLYLLLETLFSDQEEIIDERADYLNKKS